MTVQYSTAQKLSLAGMVIGALLCAVGGCAPYWLVFDPEAPGILGLGLALIADHVVSANMNAFAVCIEVKVELPFVGKVVGEKSECRIFAWDVGNIEWFMSVRMTVAACVLVGGLCGLCSLCLACCTCCRRLVAPGIMAFLAAGAGTYGAVVFSRNTEIFTKSFLGFQLTSFGWAFYVFCAGVGVLGLVSFMACFSAPEHNNAVHGTVISQPPPTHLAVISTSAPPPQQQPIMHPHSAF